MKRPLTTAQIREEFLRYFESKGHRRVPSSSLVPAGDQTLLFTNAGMNQFKDVFLGREKRDYVRATSSQKCVRAGGKHNDLENVGRTARHHTFFEMLGNFSFGDYFKKEAIEYAWDLLTRVYGLEVDRLWFTVYEGDSEVPADEEAEKLWIKSGAKPERVLRFGKKDNFWAMGDTGPCGPCTEIHYFRGSDMSRNVASLVNGEGDETMEIWNLVFMQYERTAAGELNRLPAPSVDTGAGLERLASVLQKVDSNYDTDVFAPIKRTIEKISGHGYGQRFDDEQDTAIRVLCDHARAATFLLSDGVMPANEGRGYVLRRIIRRAIRFGRKLPNPVVLSQLVDSVIEAMGDAYPDLRTRRTAVFTTLEAEEERFSKTLSVGIERVGQVLDDVRRRGERVLSGAEVFRLYDTFGIPVELIQEFGEEEGVTIDREGYEQLMQDARAKAKASSKFQAADLKVYEKIAERAGAPEFVGYSDYMDVATESLALVREGREADRLAKGEEGEIVISPTPYYAESGGQIGDAGELRWEGGRAEVLDTYKPVADLVVSRIRVVEGDLRRGAKLQASVPTETRLDTTANHTGTHLLHKALKDVLGETVQQAGSLVAPDRLRFDYSYARPLTDEQVQRIEEIVNNKIRENVEVTKQYMPMAQAKQLGAVMMFDEKYGETVRVVSTGGWSVELCGGCHVNRTGDIGLFKIISDRALAAGVRRMEALTGRKAIEYFQSLDGVARTVRTELNTPIEEVPALVKTLQERQKNLERELKNLKMKLASAGSTAQTATQNEWTEIDGIKLIARRVDELSGGDLRNLADSLRDKIKSGVVLLGTAAEGKATLLAAVTKDLVGRVPAQTVIQRLAPIIGGKGGGKPDLAQAGGKEADRLNEAIAQASQVVRDLLSAA